MACGLLIAACKLLVAACMQDLVPQPGIEPRPPALGTWSLTRWTTRGVPDFCIFLLAFVNTCDRKSVLYILRLAFIFCSEVITASLFNLDYYYAIGALKLTDESYIFIIFLYLIFIIGYNLKKKILII